MLSKTKIAQTDIFGEISIDQVLKLGKASIQVGHS